MRLLLVALLLSAPALAEEKEKPAKPKKVKITPEGPCEKKQLDELAAAIATADVKTWSATVSDGLVKACGAKLPPSVANALDDIHRTPVDEHDEAMVRALRDAQDFAKAGCAKWEETMAAHQAPGDKLRSIYKDCAMAKLNLVTEAELVEVASLGAAYAALPLHKWLTTNGMEAGNARKWTRALLGVPEPKKLEKKKDEKKGKR